MLANAEAAVGTKMRSATRSLTHAGVHAGGAVPLLQIAPMMEVTYRDFRYFMRLLTRRAQLWTEMVVDDTLLHNLEPAKCDRFLGYHPKEHPIVCQLGGSDPTKLAEAARAVERYGYDEVNLNVGCPSSRVAGKGEFGCSLMLRSETVRDIVHEMKRAVQIPVTVKCRLGVDNNDTPEFTREFVRTVAQGGCRHFIIHARKAWLNGLSPAQNRSIPPLHYTRVLDLCKEFPDLAFSVNGGILDISHARALLGLPGERSVGESDELIPAAWGWNDVERGAFSGLPPNFHGVMIGRGAMNNPVALWDADRAIYGDPGLVKPMTRRGVLEAYREYLEEMHPPTDDLERSVGSLHLAVKPTLGLFSGLRGNKAYRSTLDTIVRSKESRLLGPAHCLAEAVKAVEAANPELLDEPLALTQAFRPSAVAAARGTSGSTDAAPLGRGRKRKAGAVTEAVEATAPDATAAIGGGDGDVAEPLAGA